MLNNTQRYKFFISSIWTHDPGVVSTTLYQLSSGWSDLNIELNETPQTASDPHMLVKPNTFWKSEEQHLTNNTSPHKTHRPPHGRWRPVSLLFCKLLSSKKLTVHLILLTISFKHLWPATKILHTILQAFHLDVPKACFHKGWRYSHRS